MRKILARVGWALVVAWGIVATIITVRHQPGDPNSFFWLVLPYPLLIVLTRFIVNACARNRKSTEEGSNWFAGGLAAFAGIGLASSAAATFFTIISLAYFGRASFAASSSSESQYAMYTAINIAVFASCSIWAGAIAAALSSQRARHHSLIAAVVILLWACAVTLLRSPLEISQLVAGIVLPIPLAIWGARLTQPPTGRRNL